MKKVELADYVYVSLFKVILLFGLWMNPLFIYEEVREKWKSPKSKESGNPYLSIRRGGRSEKDINNTKGKSNGFRDVHKLQLQNSVLRER